MKKPPITKLNIRYNASPKYIIGYEVEFNPLEKPLPDQKGAYEVLRKAQAEMRNYV